MTNVNPTQAVVLKALRIAEEAKSHLAQAIEDTKQGFDVLTRNSQWAMCRETIDRLAALVQPPEAPAAVEVSRLAERHQSTNREDAAAGNVNAIRHIAYAEGYRAGKEYGLAAKASQVPSPEPLRLVEKIKHHQNECADQAWHAGDCSEQVGTPYYESLRLFNAALDQLAALAQVPSEAGRLVGGEAVLVPMETLSRWRKWCLGYEWPKGQDWDSHDVYLAIADEIRTKYEIAQAAPTDAPGEQKPNYGTDGPSDGTDHHSVWSRAQHG